MVRKPRRNRGGSAKEQECRQKRQQEPASGKNFLSSNRITALLSPSCCSRPFKVIRLFPPTIIQPNPARFDAQAALIEIWLQANGKSKYAKKRERGFLKTKSTSGPI